MTKAMIIILTGIAAVYGPYPGRRLFCDQGNGLVYDDLRGPWVAVDPDEYRSGRVHCGDWLWLTTADGHSLLAQALDAGPLYAHRIDDWPGQQIVVDVPMHLATWPLTWGGNTSTPVQVENLSARERALVAEGTLSIYRQMVTSSLANGDHRITGHHSPDIQDQHCFWQKTAPQNTSPETLPWLSPVSVHGRASRHSRLACTRQGVKLAAMASSTGRVAPPEVIP